MDTSTMTTKETLSDRDIRSGRLREKVENVSLGDLARMKRGQLDELYLLAETPGMDEVKGYTDGVVCDGIIPFNRWFGWIPWKGKRFVPPIGDDKAGHGLNRMELGRRRTLWFPFETGIIPPLTGEDRVFTLNYALPRNFWPIRIIRDDLKKLKEGLFLGSVYMKWTRKYIFMLYFALQTKSQSNQGD